MPLGAVVELQGLRGAVQWPAENLVLSRALAEAAAAGLVELEGEPVTLPEPLTHDGETVAG